MNLFLRTLFNLLVVSAAAIGAAEKPGSVPAPFKALPHEIVTLTPKGFEPHDMGGLWFIKFHSPQCGTCKEVAPKWTAAFHGFGGNTNNLTWAEVSCTDYGDLCTAHMVTSLPSIMIFKDGKKIADYSHPLEEKDFYLFANALEMHGEKGLSLPLTQIEAEMTEANLKATKQTAEDPAKAIPHPPKQESKQESKSPKTTDAPKTADHSENADEEAAEESDMLSPTDFENNKVPGLWLVKMFSPYCPHCVEFAPKWEKAYSELGGKAGTKEKGIQMGQIDCSTFGDFCMTQGVRSYPEVHLFKDGKPVEQFKGTKDTEGIKQYVLAVVKDHSGSADAGKGDKDTPAKSDNHQESPKPAEDSILHNDHVQEAAPPAAKDTDHPGNSLATQKPAQNKQPGGIDAPNPSWGGSHATYSQNRPFVLDAALFQELVKSGREPWFIKFYSPRCPHCIAMAPEWELLAKETTGKVNIAELNCDDHTNICRDLGVRGYPTLRYYGPDGARPDYQGPRTAKALEMYALIQCGSNSILPVQTLDELWGNVTTNNAEGRPSFIYTYDRSIMPEDWEALKVFAALISWADGVLYRSNEPAVVNSLNIAETGPALLYLVSNDPKDEKQRYSIPFPQSNVPQKMRDPSVLTSWFRRVIYNSVQPLQLERIGPITAAADVQAVLLLPEGEGNLPEEYVEKIYDLRRLAYSKYQEAENARLALEAEQRKTRLEAHDKAVAVKNFELAKQVILKTISVPVEMPMTYHYIRIDKWKETFGKFIHTEGHQPGQLVLLNSYKQRYIDALGTPLSMDQKDDLESVADLLTGETKTTTPYLKKFRRKIPTARKHKSPALIDFHAITTKSIKLPAFLSRNFLLYLLAVCALYFIYRMTLRKKLQMRSRGPILTGKLD